MRRPGPTQLPRLLRTATWGERGLVLMLSAIALGLLVCWVLAASDAWDGARAKFAGTAGTMTIEHCEEGSGSSRHAWTCTGTFAGGGLRLPSVQTAVAGDRPGPTVRGTVSSADAITVWVDGDSNWIFAVLFLPVLPVLAWWIYRLGVDLLEPIGGWPDPHRLPSRAHLQAEHARQPRRRRR